MATPKKKKKAAPKKAVRKPAVRKKAVRLSPVDKLVNGLISGDVELSQDQLENLRVAVGVADPEESLDDIVEGEGDAKVYIPEYSITRQSPNDSELPELSVDRMGTLLDYADYEFGLLVQSLNRLEDQLGSALHADIACAPVAHVETTVTTASNNAALANHINRIRVLRQEVESLSSRVTL